MPSPGAMSNRRFLILLVATAGFLSFSFIMLFRRQPNYGQVPIHHVEVSAETLAGGVIMPKLGNETLKAEIGRAGWKLFHTMMARFPDTPTQDESTALQSYIHLFARLYPCGECASHFRQILSKFPPQVASRSTAAAWACHVHNEVNKSLRKDLFDCSKIGDFYDCGCAEDDESSKSGAGKGTATSSDTTKPEMENSIKTKLIQNGRDFDDDDLKPLKLEKEGLTRGG